MFLMARSSAGRYAHHTDFVVVADCFSRTDAARIAGISARTLRKWRAGKARIPWAAYQLLYENSRYGLAERDSAEHFERTMILGQVDALRRRIGELEAQANYSCAQLQTMVQCSICNGGSVKPRFTDQLRYPNGYTPSDRTDVSLTFKRIREQLEKNAMERALERLTKVLPMRKETHGL